MNFHWKFSITNIIASIVQINSCFQPWLTITQIIWMVCKFHLFRDFCKYKLSSEMFQIFLYYKYSFLMLQVQARYILYQNNNLCLQHPLKFLRDRKNLQTIVRGLLWKYSRNVYRTRSNRLIRICKYTIFRTRFRKICIRTWFVRRNS